MSESKDLIALIDQRIRANQKKTEAWGTVQTRDVVGPGAYVVFDGSTTGVPVKVPGTVFAQPGDRVTLDLYGVEWIVTNSFGSPYYFRGEYGSFLLSFTAVASVTVAITYARAYSAPPLPLVTIDSGAGAALRWIVRGISRLDTGFTFYAHSADNTTDTWDDIPCSWIAVEQL